MRRLIMLMTSISFSIREFQSGLSPEELWVRQREDDRQASIELHYSCFG
ncbi:MAG: hypothetical protein HXS46_11250 [Theionarchaea archaeon]|nr:hypothetical protein [Theionarchaea archaeon]